MRELSTRRFAMSQRQLIGHLFTLHGRWWAVGSALAVAAMVALALTLHDLRYAICALIILFIVVPMLMAFLYINYALDPDCAFNVLPHTLTLTPDGIDIRIFFTPHKSRETAEVDEKKNDDDGNEEEEEEMETHRSLAYDAVGDMRVAMDSVVYKAGKDGRGLLYLPMAAFADGKEFEEFVRLLNDYIKPQRT